MESVSPRRTYEWARRWRLWMLSTLAVVVMMATFGGLSRRGAAVAAPRAAEEHGADAARRHLRVVGIGDTHGFHDDLGAVLPRGDVLVFVGDFAGFRDGDTPQLERMASWLGALPHRYKLVIGGNMDLSLAALSRQQAQQKLPDSVHYLLDSSIVIDGVTFYGSPWTPKFVGAFQLESDADAEAMAARIPDGVDVLITHGPPFGVLDRSSAGDAHLGCPKLLQRVNALKPRLHLFGHIHASYGVQPSSSSSSSSPPFRPSQPLLVPPPPSADAADADTVFANCAQYPRFQPPGRSDCRPFVFDVAM